MLATLLSLSNLAGAADLPEAPVKLVIWAYDREVTGYVVVDADKLASAGYTLKILDALRSGPRVPLSMGMRVLSTQHGEKRFMDAVDGLMLFDATGDGSLSEADATYAALYLWEDSNGDATLADDEVKTWSDIGIAEFTRFGDLKMKDRWKREEKAPAAPPKP